MILILRFGSDTSASYVTGSYKNGENEKPQYRRHCKEGIMGYNETENNEYAWQECVKQGPAANDVSS